MRSRTEIENDHKSYEALLLEVMLDVREMLAKQGRTAMLKPSAPRKKKQQKV